MTRRHFLLSLVLLLTLTVQSSAAVGIPVIVQLTSASALGGVLNILNGTLLDSIPGANIYLIRVPQLPVLTPLLSLLGVQWLEANYGQVLPPMSQLGIIQAAAGNAADWYKNQPAFQLARAGQALPYAQGQGVVVADINSQFDYSHPALAGHLTSGWDFVTRSYTDAALNQSSSDFLDQSSSDFLDQSSSDFLDQSSSDFLDGTPLLGMKPAYSHGTLCAGIIAAVAPQAMIMPLRAFDDNGSSDNFTLAKAIRYAVDHGAHVINMSFGTLNDTKVMKSQIDFAKSRGVVLIASAGNNNTSAVQYPAAYSGVTAVAATDIQDMKGSFSNFGSYVSMDAPGVNIISAYPGGLYSMVNGTSFSAPMVAGTAALVRSIKTTGVVSSISSTTVNIDAKNPGYAGKLGSGRIDILRSVHP